MESQPGIPKEWSVTRLAKVLEAAELELHDLETDFQIRLRESIRENETTLKEQFAAELAERIKQTEDEARKANTRELLQRFEVEIQKLSTEFEVRSRNSIAASENAATLRLEEARAETEHVRSDLKHEIETAAKQWEAERHGLREQITRLGAELTANQTSKANKQGLEEAESKLSELAREKARLEDEIRDSADRWNTERTTLKTEFERSRQSLVIRFDTQIQELQRDFGKRQMKAVSDAESAAETRVQEILAENKKKYERDQETHATALQSFQNAFSQFETEREQFGRRIAALEEELVKTKEQERVRTPLSKELEAKLQEAVQEKTKLEEELQQATARWKQEREGLQAQRPAPSGGGTRDVSEAVRAEISRVEAAVQEIGRKMENPSLELAAEIRLNQERIQLETYVKGLRYPPAES